MQIPDWINAVEQLIQRLYALDVAYPFGVNKILPAEAPRIVTEAFDHPALGAFGVLRDFYVSCNGLSLPDVHTGYFIKPLSRLLMADPESEPIEILGPYAGKVLVIGSTGGGDLFALRKNSLDVLCLPLGPLHSGIYDGSQSSVRVAAADFSSFLDSMREDLKAFVYDAPNHHFLV